MSFPNLTNVLLIEDDIDAVKHLSNLILKNNKNINILGNTGSIKSAIKMIDHYKPELVFMDIELTDGLSFNIFNQLQFTDFEVIFVSGYNNYINNALEHYAFSFITKPVDEQILFNTINRYLSLKDRLFSKAKIDVFNTFLNKENSQILIKAGEQHLLTAINDIIKCEANGNYTIFHLINKQQIIANNILKYYEELLTEKGFFKANRSELVNISNIESIYRKETIILKNNFKVNVSTRNKPKLINLINNLS